MNANKLAATPTRSTVYMTMEERARGIQTMLDDLDKLAKDDGCIAAAWAAEFFYELKTFTNGWEE
jgi:hypothetical protein